MSLKNKIALTIVFDNLSHWTTMPLPLNPIHSWLNLDIITVIKKLKHELKASFGENNINQSIINIRSQKKEIELKFLTALGTTMYILNRGICAFIQQSTRNRHRQLYIFPILGEI